MKDRLMRVADEFKKVVNMIRAMEVAKNGNLPSSREITKKIAKYIDPEKVWHNEYHKK